MNTTVKIEWQVTTKGIVAIANGQNVFFMKSHGSDNYSIYRILEDNQGTTESQVILTSRKEYNEVEGKSYIYNRILTGDYTVVTKPII